MEEAPRRYNLIDRRKKPKGSPLQRWEQEYAKLNDGERCIPLVETRTAIRKAFRMGGLLQWRINLNCPLSKERIKVPARYANCTHIECFDLETFLRMKTQQNFLVCPVCQKDVEKALENLRIDRYIQNVLSSLPDATDVDLQPDGSFTEVQEQPMPPIVIDDSAAYVPDRDTPVPEIKPEASDDHNAYITLDDTQEGIQNETTTSDVNTVSLMPLDIHIKPQICKQSQSTPSVPNEADREHFNLNIEEDFVDDFSSPEVSQMLVSNNVHIAEENEPQSAIGDGAEKISETENNYFCAISSAIREYICETNATEHNGTIEKVRNSDVTGASAIVADQAPDNGNDRLSKQNNTQSTIHSATSGGITALVSSVPILTEIPSPKRPKGQIEPLQNEAAPTKLRLNSRKRTPDFNADLSDTEEDSDECVFLCVKRKRDHPSRTKQSLPQIVENDSVTTSIVDGQNQPQHGFGERSHESETDDEDSEYVYESDSYDDESGTSNRALTNKTRSHGGRKEARRESNKNKIQSEQLQKARPQLKKKRREQQLPRIQKSNSVPVFVKAVQNLRQYGFEESADESETDNETLISETRQNQNTEDGQCESSNKVFAGRKSRNNRVSKHKKEQLHKCDQCSFSSTKSSQLVIHIRSHAGTKIYECDQCPYITDNIYLLQRHMRRHTGEKPFKCEHCSYASAYTGDLKKHIHSCHTNKKSFRCDQCSFSAAYIGNLYHHIRSCHTKLKPFKCEECSYATCRKDHLKSHIRFRHA